MVGKKCLACRRHEDCRRIIFENSFSTGFLQIEKVYEGPLQTKQEKHKAEAAREESIDPLQPKNKRGKHPNQTEDCEHDKLTSQSEEQETASQKTYAGIIDREDRSLDEKVEEEFVGKLDGPLGERFGQCLKPVSGRARMTETRSWT